jgi:ABC-type multidrug transport system fused ATPase/permease subunit
MLVRLLREYLRPYGRPIALVLVLQLIQTLASLYLPSLNADIIDNGVITGDTAYIMRTGALMLGISLVQVACAIVAVYYGAKTAMAFGRNVREGLFTHVQSFSAREVGQFGAPSLITRTSNDIQQVQMVVLMTFTMMVAAPIMLIGGVIMALRQDVELSRLLLVMVPVLGVVIGLLVSRMLPYFRAMQKRIDAINRVMREQISGIRVVRAFVRERHEAERFASANDDLRVTSLRVGRLMALMFPTVMLVMNASSIAVLWFGAQRIDSGQMQVISFTAEPGQTTAIIGSTGSGKSTLIGLIPRLFDATAGSVLIDGVDVKDLDPENLWSLIGLIPQQPYLFSGTVGSNLRYGDHDATDEKLWEALTVAQARDFVDERDGGLESPIAQGGTDVSGGQRQRLAIARALVREPLVYLFDDSFSALDYATDAALRAALVPCTREAAVIIVAQRVATIRGADQIIVLDEGRIVGRGTHSELLAGCETYQEIVYSQLSVEEAA